MSIGAGRRNMFDGVGEEVGVKEIDDAVQKDSGF